MAEKDYYAILGVNRNADEQTIKKAYRKLARKYHPDTNPGDKVAEQKFKDVNEAYEVLGDEKKKKLYDTYGSAAFEQGFQEGAGQGGQGPFGGFGGFDFGNGTKGSYRSWSFGGNDGKGGYSSYSFNGNADDIFGDIFGDMFGSSGFTSRHSSYGHQANARGADLKSEIDVSFDDAAFGCEKVIQFRDQETGRIQSLKVHIPAGIEDGKTVRLRGKGAVGPGGSGDLLLKVHVQGRPGFSRKGKDIYTTAQIPFTTAVFGGEAQVPTLEGTVKCRIPAGIQSGKKIRLRGKGACDMKNPNVRGDEFVVVQIDVPRDLSEQAKQKLREFEQICQRDRNNRRNGSVA